MKKETVAVKGMHCASCATIISKTLNKVNGVKQVDVNYATEKANIEYDSEETNLIDLNKKIEAFGYSLEIHDIAKDTDSFSNEHTAHLELNKSKNEKILELNKLKEKVEFTLPITFFVFVLMVWEILARTYITFPRFFIPMELYNIIIFLISSIILFWVGNSFVNAVFRFIKFRVANMDTLIGIGTLTAYIYSTIVVLFPQIKDLLNLPETTYFDVTIVVIGFIVLGKYLESKSKLKTGEAIEKLINLQAKTAIVEKNGKEMEIPVEQVELGDTIIIKPGSKIPVDGKIIEGSSSIDESMVTGESIPTDKVIDDFVIGGTINKQGYFKFKATKVGSETMLSNIIKMVENAQGSKAPIQKLADKISSIFVPIVLIIALLTLITWLIIGTQFMSFENSLSLGLVCFVGILVIACPCALGLATPTAIIVGVGKGAQNGILIKDAKSLEQLHKVDVVVVDKTGTITKGKPEVTDIILINNSSFKNDKDVLNIIGSLEKLSEHPLAEAVVNKSISENIKFKEVKDFQIIEGKGLKGKIADKEYFAGNLKLLGDLNIKFERDEIDKLTKQGKTPVILTDNQSVLAIIAVADTIKEDASQAVRSLHELGVKVVMLTGDNINTAKYIADQVSIDEVFAEVLPNEKANIVSNIQRFGFADLHIFDQSILNPEELKSLYKIIYSSNNIQDIGKIEIDSSFGKLTIINESYKNAADEVPDYQNEFDYLENIILLNNKKVAGLKNHFIKNKKATTIVAMAGDGVNDAPALAQSDIGIAMGTGTDIAIESADITLLNGDISKIAKAIKLSKLTMKTVKQNLFWAFIYNIIGIPLAAGVFYPIFGWLLNPIFAGLAMAFSSVSVVGNSLRLKTKKI